MFNFQRKPILILSLGLVVCLIILAIRVHLNNETASPSSYQYQSSYEEGENEEEIKQEIFEREKEIRNTYNKEKTEQLENIEYLVGAILENVCLGKNNANVLQENNVYLLSDQINFLNSSQEYLETNFKASEIWSFKYVYLYNSIENTKKAIIIFTQASAQYGKTTLPENVVKDIRQNYSAGYTNYCIYWGRTDLK